MALSGGSEKKRPRPNSTNQVNILRHYGNQNQRTTQVEIYQWQSQDINSRDQQANSKCVFPPCLNHRLQDVSKSNVHSTKPDDLIVAFSIFQV
jgi:hypothetical protein